MVMQVCYKHHQGHRENLINILNINNQIDIALNIIVHLCIMLPINLRNIWKKA